MVPYNYYGALATGIREVAFFYHLKSHSYIVATTGICMLSAHNDVTKCKTGAVVNVEIIYGQTLEQSEGKMLFFFNLQMHILLYVSLLIKKINNFG